MYESPASSESVVKYLAEKLRWKPSYGTADALIAILDNPARLKSFKRNLERAIRRDNAQKNIDGSDSEPEDESSQYNVQSLEHLCNTKLPRTNQ